MLFVADDGFGCVSCAAEDKRMYEGKLASILSKIDMSERMITDLNAAEVSWRATPAGLPDVLAQLAAPSCDTA